jgi:decaprenylphospho-beta-D-ribofuranose 2-oxidase
MPQLEALASRAPQRLASATTTISGWGGGAGARVLVLRPDRASQVTAAVAQCAALSRGVLPAPGAIPRGMGRSYGDAAQLSGGLVLDMTALTGFTLDDERGVVTAEAGVTIGDLLGALVPRGWMVPVVPGTQHVSVGGAIAGDIHGKNHGTAGTFGSHVEAIELLTSAGELLDLEPGDPLFEATLGGMGLTGVIVSARIRLLAVSGPMLSVDTDRVGTLDEALAALSASGGPYRVAWLDLLSSRPGRGIVTRAEHVEERGAVQDGRASATVAARATVPRGWPGLTLRPTTVAAFNELRYRSAPRRERGRIEAIGGHMFPLDGLAAWPRLYGRRGFVQYQLVVPPGDEHVLHATIEELRRSRVPCFLAVLKDFGESNGAPMSFPIRGWTLALDLPRAADGLEQLLTSFDELVAAARGRVYLSKDARLRAEALRAMYPRIDEWRAVRDGADPDALWRSDLAVRTGLVAAA